MTANSFLTRAVIDTSVLVSAALFVGSVPNRAVELAFAQAQVLIAEPLILELGSVLSRPKFKRHITPGDRRSFLTRVALLGTMVSITSDLRVCRDPKDNHILNLAMDGQASLIITGDEDLLVLDPFRGIEIITPAAFLAR